MRDKSGQTAGGQYGRLDCIGFCTEIYLYVICIEKGTLKGFLRLPLEVPFCMDLKNECGKYWDGSGQYAFPKRKRLKLKSHFFSFSTNCESNSTSASPSPVTSMFLFSVKPRR